MKAADSTKDKNVKAIAFHTKGGIEEEIAREFNERSRYTAAIDDYKHAIDQASSHGEYWLDRGRCWFHYSQAMRGVEDKSKQSAAIEGAKKDLLASMEGGKTISPEQRSEALYWLAMAYRRQEKPEFSKAVNCLDESLKPNTLPPKLCADAFTALLAIGETLGRDCGVWKGAEITAIKNADDLDLAARCCHVFSRKLEEIPLSDYSGVKSEVVEMGKHQRTKDGWLLYANGHLRSLADAYWKEGEKRNLDKVLEIVNLGLPEKGVLQSTYAHTYCLNRRNVIYATQMDKLQKANQRKVDKDLVAEGEHGVKIAQEGFEKGMHVSYLAAARAAAARLCENAGDKTKALQHIEAGLALSGLDEPTKTQFEAEKKRLKN
jgi:tetratricopeptide (TPR) repeat protein